MSVGGSGVSVGDVSGACVTGSVGVYVDVGVVSGDEDGAGSYGSVDVLGE